MDPRAPAIPEIGQEIVPPHEAEQIDQLLAIHRTIQEARDRKEKPVPRDVHPKQHGCVRAELLIEREVPAELRHGLFREARTYSAVVRFSNAKQHNDQLPDAHGLAVKLLDVEGARLRTSDSASSDTTHDFVLVDHPIFFARNVAEMIQVSGVFHDLMIAGPLGKGRALLKGAVSLKRPFRILRTMAKRPDNPLTIQYWSTTPFKLGAGAVKFSLRPQRSDVFPPETLLSPDKLRLAMAAQLQASEARFDLLVQRQINAETMPIEDPTVEWDEAHAPPQKVATLLIPRQISDSPAQLQFGENLSFNPWHGLAEHRPLGGINRARRKLYEVMSTHRRDYNGRPISEPTLVSFRKTFA
jgi:hypothetical protein